ncbi:hypothetical protein F5B20DRAFT_582650 [Whalleya microplaca]|nr:hypothetical protein F5B20DRAFT_582650 [Whalleya microplaca]
MRLSPEALARAWRIFTIVFCVYFIIENWEPCTSILFSGRVARSVAANNSTTLYSNISDFFSNISQYASNTSATLYSDVGGLFSNLSQYTSNVSTTLIADVDGLSINLSQLIPTLMGRYAFNISTVTRVSTKTLTTYITSSIFRQHVSNVSTAITASIKATYLAPSLLGQYASNISIVTRISTKTLTTYLTSSILGQHVSNVSTATTASNKTLSTHLASTVTRVSTKTFTTYITSSILGQYVSNVSTATTVSNKALSTHLASSICKYPLCSPNATAESSKAVSTYMLNLDFAPLGFLAHFISFIRSSQSKLVLVSEVFQYLGGYRMIVNVMRFPPIFTWWTGVLFYGGYTSTALYATIMHGIRSRTSVQLLWLVVVTPILIVVNIVNAWSYFDPEFKVRWGTWFLTQGIVLLSAFLVLGIIRSNVHQAIVVYTCFDVLEHWDGGSDEFPPELRRTRLPSLLYNAALRVFNLTNRWIPFHPVGSRLRLPREHDVRNYVTPVLRWGGYGTVMMYKPETLMWMVSRGWLP